MSRPLLVLVLLLAACTDAAPDPVAGTADRVVPTRPSSTLTATTPVPGEVLTLEVSGAAPGASVAFFAGRAAGVGPCPAGLGVCLGLVRPRLIGSGDVDGDGHASLDVVLPDTTPVGSHQAYQAVTTTAVSRVTTVAARTVSAPIAVEGVWVDDFGYEHEVDSRTWLDLGTYDVLRLSNARASAVARNGAGTWNPGAYSRFDWTRDAAGELWMCQSAYDAPSLAQALRAPRADDRDPATSGCGSFAWSHLAPAVLDLSGSYTDQWGTSHTIDGTLWDMSFASFHVTRWSNARRFVIAHNDAANLYDPGRWSRFDWTEDGTGDLWYCQTRYDAATEAEARAAEPADPTDPSQGGCAGFAWTLLTP